MGQMTIEQQQALAMASARLRLQQSTATGSMADQIPGYGGPVPASTAAPERPESGFFGKLMAPLETAVTLGTGVISAPIVEGAKIFGTLTSGKFGTQAGIRAGEATGRKVQQFFQPTVSPESERQTAAISNALASTGLQGVPLNMMGNLATLAGPAVQQVAPVIKAPIEARQQRLQEARVAKSYKNASTIDAAEAAYRQGFALNPAESNPSVGNKLTGVLAGNADIDARLSEINVQRVTDKVREKLGVAATEKLDDVAIERALDRASAPYAAIREMPVLQTPDSSIAALKTLKKQSTIGGESKTTAINNLVDEALAKLQQTTTGPFSGVGGGPVAVGRSGAMVLDDIRSMRREAQATYQAQKINPDPLAVAKADTQMKIANILEDVVDANAPNPQVLNDLRAARTEMAQIYDHARALDYATNTVDPMVYAKLLDERKGNMTGLGADIGLAAAKFPKDFSSSAVAGRTPRLTRSGLGGTLGFIAGGVPGAAAGMLAGYTASAIQAKRMMSPSYQRRYAMPEDYRPIPSGLRPVEPNVPVNALAPYDYSQQAFTPPNFVMQGEQYGPRVTTPGFAPGPAQLPAPSAEGTMGTLRAEQQRAAGMSRTLGQQAEAQQAAAEATARQSTRGGTAFDLDPVTGKLVPVDTTLRGATPDIQIIESTGKSLSGAADILSSGKSPALMTAEQRIAWGKTKVDLAEVVPGMKTLSDKALAAKLMDRVWLQETIDKVKQKAQMQADIAARSDNERLRQAAMVEREKLNSSLELLEEQFRKARPVKTGGQGPKTRAFQRNMLRPEGDDIQNALIK